jgi:Tol biopolymer transport system component
MTKMTKTMFVFAIILTLAFAAVAQQLPATAYQAVTWSRDGKYLVFTGMLVKSMNPFSMEADVYISRPNGSEMKKVTGAPSDDFSPVWSKDGKRVYFAATDRASKTSEIASVKTDGSGLVQITKGTGRNSEPSISPDGKKIAFETDRDGGKVQIYVMNIDGTDLKRLTNDPAIAFYTPVWSPDGKRLVYYAEKGDRKDQVWTMNADGSNQTLLTNNVGHNFYPAWSIDGKRIIFCTTREGAEGLIYQMNADGSDPKRLLQMPASWARYSPDGKRIAFISGKFPNTAVYVANADGSDAKKITP